MITDFRRTPKTSLLRGLVLAAALLVSSFAASAQAPGPADGQAADTARPAPPPPPVPGGFRPNPTVPDLPVAQKIRPGVFALGELEISKTARSVSLPAVINMSKGLLEYVLVRNGGKTHESLLRTQVDPVHLHLAMLLVGAEGTDRPLARQGAPEIPKGNRVDVTVHYLKNGRLVPLKPEAWIVRKSSETIAEAGALDWVFTGSVIHNGRFLAQTEGSMITLYHDPAALIDNASPGGESDRIWFVNETAVPPVGTPVTVTITVRN